MTRDSILFIPYGDTLELLTAEDAMRICEAVYLMHSRDSVVWSKPPSFKLDVADDFHAHWHVKGVFLKEIPATGVRLYSYYDDGVRNTVGQLDCTRFIVLSDPHTSEPLCIVDEHWIYAIRSAAAAVVPCKWLGLGDPKVLGLVGIGTMGTNSLRCLNTLYKFAEIRCTSRRPQTRKAFAEKWSKKLGIPVIPVDTVEEVARSADIVVGGTTSTDIVCREQWLKPGCTFISLARRELDPSGWAKMDKVVVDHWDLNMLSPIFRKIVESGQFTQEQLHAEIADIVSEKKSGRERDDERILIHTTGMASQDIAIAQFVYTAAVERGLGMAVPSAVAPLSGSESGPPDAVGK